MPDIGPRSAGVLSSALKPPSAIRLGQDDGQGLDLDAIDVALNIDAPEGEAVIDPKTGAAQIELADGGVLIDFNPQPAVNDNGPKGHDENLAEKLPEAELARISEELLRGIQLDEQSRTEWLQTRAQGIRLLGLKIEQPRGSMDASVALEGMSTVRHPLLLEAVLRFQANARGELLPASGPVKVSDKTDENGNIDTQAEALEDDLNYYLTVGAPEYYPDTDRALFATGFSGCAFKKVYNCPIRNRPVSESVDAKDLIVSDSATDLRNSARVTHQIKMRPSILKRMQLALAYRNLPIPTASSVDINPVDQQIADTQGIDISAQQQAEENREHTIYEVYCELNIAGFEHKQDGEVTGLPLPYRVVIEKDSRTVLEIRRNWDKDDPRKLAKICFVKYPYVPGLGFYDIGLIHILGNLTNALTAAEREMLDAGMFANFPGLLVAKGLSRQNSNEIRVPPGGAAQIETNGMAIGDAIMPLPYRDISVAYAQFIQHLEETGQRLGGTAETNIGEGVQNAPVGTTLALIDQATKVESAVHKRLHAAQSEEFQLLKQCFRENPESFVNTVKAKGTIVWDVDSFLAALEKAAIVPVADPNTPSHMHRLMKAMGVKQLASANPPLYNMKAVDEYVMQQAGVADPDRFFAVQTGAPQANPELLLKAKEIDQKPQLQAAKDAADLRETAAKIEMQHNESADQAAERASREKIAQIGLAEAILDHHDKQAETAADMAEAGVRGAGANGS